MTFLATKFGSWSGSVMVQLPQLTTSRWKQVAPVKAEAIYEAFGAQEISDEQRRQGLYVPMSGLSRKFGRL